MILSSEFPPGPGGIGTHSHQLATRLGQAGWEVQVVTRQDYAPIEEVRAFNASQPFATTRLRPVPFAPLEALYRWSTVSRRIRSGKPDALLASGARFVWLAAAMEGRSGLPWVAVGHGGEFGVQSSFARRLTRWSFGRASGVVAVSAYTLSRMRAMGIAPRRVVVIPNGADADRFRVLPPAQVAAYRQREGVSDGPLLLSVGNVSERKGHDVVIRALPEILRSAPRVRYWIAGLPTRKSELTALAASLGVTDHVRFLGRVGEQELVEILNACDLFVMTSRHTPDGGFEGYGIAVVEAALCGKPAVVSSGSGLTEAIEEGRTGLSVREGDERQTARAIVSLLADPERLWSMGEAARRRALSEQTWQRRAALYDDFLRSVTAPNGRSRGEIPETEPAAAGRP